ncbi:hypothetical protein QTP88_024250 [Uroleucon formosanum]
MHKHKTLVGLYQNILQPDDESRTGPIEDIEDDVVAMPAVQAAVEAPSDEAKFVTPARGAEVRNSSVDLIGWLDPGATAAVRADGRRLGSRPLRGWVSPRITPKTKIDFVNTRFGILNFDICMLQLNSLCHRKRY